MTPVEMAAYVRLKTRTNANTFTDADMLILANKVKNDVCDRALKADKDVFSVPTTLNLVANRREYPLLSSYVNRLERVEAKFNGTDFIRLLPIDLSEITTPVGTEAQITARFSNDQDNAFYDLQRNALMIYSGTIADVAAGLKVWLNTRPANISSVGSTNDMSLDPSTTTHGIPMALHSVIATGIIIEYKQGREKPIPLNEREQKWEYDVEQAIEVLKKANTDEEIWGGEPDDDGSEY